MQLSSLSILWLFSLFGLIIDSPVVGYLIINISSVMIAMLSSTGFTVWQNYFLNGNKADCGCVYDAYVYL